MRLYTVLKEDDVPVLRRRAEVVKVYGAELEQVAWEMLDCMRSSGGIGLAAPQVGISQRIVVMQLPESEPVVMVNPVYQALPCDPFHQAIEEGCLSIPGFAAEVERFSYIRVCARDVKGRKFEFEADDLLAICVQHECDHLDGILFVDHLSRRQQRRFWQEVEKHRIERLTQRGADGEAME